MCSNIDGFCSIYYTVIRFLLDLLLKLSFLRNELTSYQRILSLFPCLSTISLTAIFVYDFRPSNFILSLKQGLVIYT